MTDLDIIGALRELEELSQAEYGVPLVDVVEDADRLRRLTGVMIKKPFGESHGLDGRPTATGALRYWEWDESKLTNPDDPSSPEYQLVDELRVYVGRDRPSSDFAALVDEAKYERGLFKIAAGWLHDKLQGHETQSWRDYYGADESKKAAGLLDLADMVANFALTPLYVAALPAGGFVVPMLLLAAKHGYAAVFDSERAPERET